MLACWECRNLERFVQVSTRRDARELVQSPGSGLRAEPFARVDDRPPALYCNQCGKPVEGDIEALGLVDDRIDFVDPRDFRAGDLEEELRALRADADWTRHEWPAQAAEHGELREALHPRLLEALDRTNRRPLYRHQAEALDAALRGEHVIQATAAGSGKSLGLTIPVLHQLLEDPMATGILVFPLRALANDQLSALARLGIEGDPWVSPASFDLRLSADSPAIRVSRYDGSTADHERPPIRRHARLVITTPDMLHASVLRMGDRTYKDGTSWGRLLGGLSCVVLDEVHTYQGVFGSNVAQVIRRLRRLAAAFGRRPQFLTASATVGNPVELVEGLTGVQPFRLIDHDGSARARRMVVVCNPPERTAAATRGQETRKGDDSGLLAGRIAPQTVAIELVTQALAAEGRLPVRTIAFARARNAVFQLTQRIRSNLAERHRNELSPTVAPYAATFLSGDRIEAEGKLRDGSTLAVVSTSALELGIDIPDLSLAVLVGYPGQISSFRQRVGRVGRVGEGLAILVVGDDPLQQWLARDPAALDGLMRAEAESVVINPDAPQIARRFGLLPAQEELGGIAFEDEEFFGPIVHDWLAEATGPPDREVAGIAYWKVADEDDDGAYVNLRSAGGADAVTVFKVAGRTREAIGTIDRGSAPRDCFVPAIWTGPDGELFRVLGFDHRVGEVDCEGPLESVTFQTRGISIDRATVAVPHRAPRQRGVATLEYGELEIVRQVVGYKEQHFSGAERTREPERSWPPVEFRTDGLYVQIPSTMLPGGSDPDAVIRAVEHVLLAVAPVLIACDPYDLDASSDRSGVYLYDSFGGGLKLSEPLFDRFDQLVDIANEVVATCPCESGCPSCVMLARRPDGNANLSKVGAVHVIEQLVAARA